MILTCPNCASRYLLPATALGREGRRVKCSGCGEIWFQLADMDELGHTEKPKIDRNMEIGFEEIPDSVKPIRETGLVLPQAPRENRFSKGVMTGYATAACVFVLVLIGLMFARETIAAAWPPSIALYQAMGLQVAMPGQGLAFGDVAARAAPAEGGGGEFIELSGSITNNNDTARALPPLEAVLNDKQGNVAERWLVDLPEGALGAGQSLTFSSSHKAAGENGDVRIGFILKSSAAKIAAAGAGNNQARLQDGQIPPSASAGGGESPAPASSPVHLESSP